MISNDFSIEVGFYFRDLMLCRLFLLLWCVFSSDFTDLRLWLCVLQTFVFLSVLIFFPAVFNLLVYGILIFALVRGLLTEGNILLMTVCWHNLNLLIFTYRLSISYIRLIFKEPSHALFQFCYWSRGFSSKFIRESDFIWIRPAKSFYLCILLWARSIILRWREACSHVVCLMLLFLQCSSFRVINFLRRAWMLLMQLLLILRISTTFSSEIEASTTLASSISLLLMLIIRRLWCRCTETSRNNCGELSILIPSNALKYSFI